MVFEHRRRSLSDPVADDLPQPHITGFLIPPEQVERVGVDRSSTHDIQPGCGADGCPAMTTSPPATAPRNSRLLSSSPASACISASEYQWTDSTSAAAGLRTA